MKGPGWIYTPTDRIDLWAPRPDQIHIDEIALRLAREGRFTNGTPTLLSVAAHSVWVSILVGGLSPNMDRGLATAGLLHDAAEAYLGDLIHPLKALCPEYTKVEEIWNTAIECRFSEALRGRSLSDPAIRDADRWLAGQELLEHFGIDPLAEWGPHWAALPSGMLEPEVARMFSERVRASTWSPWYREADARKFLERWDFCTWNGPA